MPAAIILSAVGSLTQAAMRYANEESTSKLVGQYEIVSLSGTLGSTSGSHLHLSVSDKTGKTLGGHLVEGSKIYTTLEVAVGELNEIEFQRPIDPISTFNELKVRPRKENY